MREIVIFATFAAALIGALYYVGPLLPQPRPGAWTIGGTFKLATPPQRPTVAKNSQDRDRLTENARSFEHQAAPQGR